MSALEPRTERSRERGRHWIALGLALTIIVMALLLEVQDGQRIAFRFLPGWPLPESCLSRRMFHFACPGCGMTRSLVHLFHGEWSESWRMHRLGWLIALLIVAQVPYRSLALLFNRRPWLSRATTRLICVVLAGLMVTVWLVQLVAGLFP